MLKKPKNLTKSIDLMGLIKFLKLNLKQKDKKCMSM